MYAGSIPISLPKVDKACPFVPIFVKISSRTDEHLTWLKIHSYIRLL